MSYNFCLFFNFLVPKAYVFENFTWVIIHIDFVGFFLGFPIKKMTLTILNTSSHINWGRFVGD